MGPQRCSENVCLPLESAKRRCSAKFAKSNTYWEVNFCHLNYWTWIVSSFEMNIVCIYIHTPLSTSQKYILNIHRVNKWVIVILNTVVCRDRVCGLMLTTKYICHLCNRLRLIDFLPWYYDLQGRKCDPYHESRSLWIERESVDDIALFANKTLSRDHGIARTKERPPCGPKANFAYGKGASRKKRFGQGIWATGHSIPSAFPAQRLLWAQTMCGDPQPMKIKKRNNNNQIVVTQWTRQRSLHDARFLEELPDLTHTKGHPFTKEGPGIGACEGLFPCRGHPHNLLLGIPWIWMDGQIFKSIPSEYLRALKNCAQLSMHASAPGEKGRSV